MPIFKILGWLSLVFGILVIAFPDLLGWLVGGFFVISGLNLLFFGYSVKTR